MTRQPAAGFNLFYWQKIAFSEFRHICIFLSSSVLSLRRSKCSLTYLSSSHPIFTGTLLILKKCLHSKKALEQASPCWKGAIASKASLMERDSQHCTLFLKFVVRKKWEDLKNCFLCFQFNFPRHKLQKAKICHTVNNISTCCQVDTYV